jgi:hypothetical protein
LSARAAVARDTFAAAATSLRVTPFRFMGRVLAETSGIWYRFPSEGP